MAPRRLDTSTLTTGTTLPPQAFTVRRGTLVRYAGASGDFNPIHWDEHFATSVGLPDVIAHGMLTMALAVRVVTDWVGDPGAVLDYRARFTRPVVVAHNEGAVVEVSGVVAVIEEDADGTVGRTARVDLTATSAGAKVLGQARVLVRLPT